jgi:AcrR family transcriptional regulator
MPRQTRQQIDDEIIDWAATLFARHGFQETSVQRIADAVGYSKGGLLRHYPSKEALQEAVVSRCLADLAEVARAAAERAAGPERDHAALTGLAQLALRRPGFVALLLSTLLRDPSAQENAALQPVADIVAEAFALTPDTDLGRSVRVAGAVGALAVARTALRDQLSADAVDHLIKVGYDALGHPATAQPGGTV